MLKNRAWMCCGLALALGVLNGAVAQTEPSPVVHVALFVEHGCTDPKSFNAVEKVLTAGGGIQVDKVTSATVRTPGFFDDYDVFILPGGSGAGEARAMGTTATRELAQAVRAGKGLIGICAGGYFISEGWTTETRELDIVNVRNHDGAHWARGEAFIPVNLLTATGETSHTMWYENGPILAPSDMESVANYTPLARYGVDMAAKNAPTGQMIGRDAVIAAYAQRGRVVAFGPHPELSPDVNHWLVNAVRWASRASEGTAQPITAEHVLEGAP